MKAIILDTETTGLTNCRPVEIAWMDVSNPTSRFASLYNPGIPIEFGAMATHHITDERVEKCVSHTEFRLPEGLEYLIGHNIDFDWKVLQTCGEMPDVKRICTLAMGRFLYPETDSHTLTAMLYMLDRPYAKEHAQKAHGAAADVEMTNHLFGLLVKKARDSGYQVNGFGELYAFSEAARIPTVMSFGKHKGMKISALPGDYVQWLFRQNDLDPYLLKALRT